MKRRKGNELSIAELIARARYVISAVWRVSTYCSQYYNAGDNIRKRPHVQFEVWLVIQIMPLQLWCTKEWDWSSVRITELVKAAQRKCKSPNRSHMQSPEKKALLVQYQWLILSCTSVQQGNQLPTFPTAQFSSKIKSLWSILKRQYCAPLYWNCDFLFTFFFF